MTQKKRVLLGMSGGVDSSVAAVLLLEQGYDVTGITLRLWSEEDDPEALSEESQAACGKTESIFSTCCSLNDVNDARKVAERLNIPHYVFNFKDDFLQQVVLPFIEEYRHGRTPNPCIRCNQEIKFNLLLRRAIAMGFDYLATGHYARVETDPTSGQKLLCRGLDPRKDQSYVLYGLSESQLNCLLLPLGSFNKKDIRALAEQHGLINARKPDSQEICFIDHRGYRSFLQRRQAAGVPGAFIDQNGREIGIHQGIGHYTIGQRKGLGMAFGQPMFVTEIDEVKNQVHLGPESELLAAGLMADQITWTSERMAIEADMPIRILAQIRYQAEPQPALLTLIGPNQASVVFDEPQRAITPGQAVVFSQQEIILGGGRIMSKL